MPLLTNPRWLRECPKCKNYDEWWVVYHRVVSGSCVTESLDPYNVVHDDDPEYSIAHLHVQCPTCGFSIIEAPESERDAP